MTENKIQNKEKAIQNLIECAEHHILEKEYHLVEDCYNSALEIDSENITVLSQKSDFLRFQGRCDEANLCLNRILSKSPRDYLTYFRKGMLLAQMELYSEAAKWFNEGVQIQEQEEIENHSKTYQQWLVWNNKCGLGLELVQQNAKLVVEFKEVAEQ